ncbi:MAG: hypothetical protein ABFD29_10505 [Anaerolineaceae bacterium]
MARTIGFIPKEEFKLEPEKVEDPEVEKVEDPEVEKVEKTEPPKKGK